MKKIEKLSDEKLTKLTQIQNTINEGKKQEMTAHDLQLLFQSQIQPYINEYKQNE